MKEKELLLLKKVKKYKKKLKKAMTLLQQVKHSENKQMKEKHISVQAFQQYD